MDFGLGEEVEPTGSTSEGMWERRVAPGRSSAVTSVGGVRRTMGASGFGMGFGGSVVADASRCLGASQEPCRLLGRPWASGGRVGSAVSPVKTRWKPARSRRAPCCLLRRRPGLQEDVLLPPCGQEELVRRWR